jgi:trk system potassium uptake protein TrkA
VVCLYRDNKFILPEESMVLKAGDEVVIIAHRQHLADLVSHWGP